jgi:hypothetical protein
MCGKDELVSVLELQRNHPFILFADYFSSGFPLCGRHPFRRAKQCQLQEGCHLEFFEKSLGVIMVSI